MYSTPRLYLALRQSSHDDATTTTTTTMTDTPNSGASTPNDSRFTSQAVTVEDRLKADTVGLVTLDDFRKRRAEALEAADGGTSSASAATTPDGR